MAADLEIVDDERASRYEVTVDGVVSELVYKRRGDRIVLLHTGVPGELEGRGIGSALVKFAIDDARAKGLTVVVQCPFATAWLHRHPEAGEGLDVRFAGGSDDGT
jgi:predicted GNAT family acetyltransferase